MDRKQILATLLLTCMSFSSHAIIGSWKYGNDYWSGGCVYRTEDGAKALSVPSSVNVSIYLDISKKQCEAIPADQLIHIRIDGEINSGEYPTCGYYEDGDIIADLDNALSVEVIRRLRHQKSVKIEILDVAPKKFTVDTGLFRSGCKTARPSQY